MPEARPTLAEPLGPASTAGTHHASEPAAPRTPGRPGPSAPAAVAGWALAAGSAVVVALLLAGSAPQAPIPGLPDAGPVTGWALRAVPLVQHAAALAVVGALLLALLAGRGTSRWSSAAAGAWSLAALAEIALGLAEVTGRPVQAVLDLALLSFYVEQVAAARALLAQAALAAALAVALALGSARTRAGALGTLLAGLVTLTPPLLAGHAASAGNHRLAQVALVAHVVAAVLWVGGLAALVAVGSSADLRRAARRYSALALPSAAVLTASGLVGAWIRLEAVDDLWTTSYGGLLLAKTAGLAALLLAGAAHRRRTLPLLGEGRDASFRRLAAVEVGVMAAVFGLAVALARTSA